MNVLRPFLKAMLTNRSLWFWGGAFMVFWLVLGAFIFSSGLPSTAIPAFTASWFAVTSLFSLSTLAIGISASIAYATAALAYGFRFTLLKPRDYLFSLLAGTGVLGLTLTVIMLGSTVGVFGARFHLTLLPADPVALVGAAVLAGAFMMALSVTLMLLVVNFLGLRNTSFVSFVPLLLSYVFGLGEVNVAVPSWLLYGSPFSDISALLYQGFTGGAPPVELASASSGTLGWPWLLASLLAWTGLLLLGAAYLLRHIRVRSIEEGRQM